MTIAVLLWGDCSLCRAVYPRGICGKHAENRKGFNMKAPKAIDALEIRIAANITSGRELNRGRMQWFIEAKGFPHAGHGETAAMAAHDFLIRNHLETKC
jgi:hypothetical protein